MRALLSVSDKTGLVELARGLSERGVELVSTGGTARAIADAGIAVTGVSEITGFPEMMDGRVKTLHPAVHGGILARRARPDDLSAIAEQGIQPTDLVVVNLYPFAKTATAAGTTFDELVEQIDIGGPSMVRAAAKNFADVLIVVDPGDYEQVLRALDQPGGPEPVWRFELAKKAFAHTAAYDATIAAVLDRVKMGDGQFVHAASGAGWSGARPSDGIGLPSDRTFGMARTHTSWLPSIPTVQGGGLERRGWCKAKASRLPTCSISTRPPVWPSSSVSQPLW